MRHPIIKNTLWLLLLTTFIFATFQPLWLEVAHRVAHLGDQIHHHHFHDHGTDHSHQQLATIAKDAEQQDDPSLPTSTKQFTFKQLLAVIPVPLIRSVATSDNAKIFPTSSILPHSIFLECETPPPDQFLSVG